MLLKLDTAPNLGGRRQAHPRLRPRRVSIVTIPLSGLVSEIFSPEVSDRQNDRTNDRQTREVIIRVANLALANQLVTFAQQ